MPDSNGVAHLKDADLGPALSHLHAVLQRGRFAVTAEIGPPRGANLAPIRRKAKLLRDWVDAANVTDGQSAVVRMASWAGCLVAMQEGLEPVMQLQCRDRNRIALQSRPARRRGDGHPERAAADRRSPALRRPARTPRPSSTWTRSS